MRCEVRWQQGHPREAIEIAKAAIRDAKASRRWTPSLGIHRDGRRLSDAGPAGARGARPPRSGDPTKLGRTREAATIESNLGVQAYSEGRWDDAIAWYRRAQEHALESGDLRSSAVAGVKPRRGTGSREAPGEAEAMLPDVRRVLRASGRIPFALLAEMQQTRIMIERGELERQWNAVEDLRRGLGDRPLRRDPRGGDLLCACPGAGR